MPEEKEKSIKSRRGLPLQSERLFKLCHSAVPCPGAPVCPDSFPSLLGARSLSLPCHPLKHRDIWDRLIFLRETMQAFCCVCLLGILVFARDSHRKVASVAALSKPRRPLLHPPHNGHVRSTQRHIRNNPVRRPSPPLLPLYRSPTPSFSPRFRVCLTLFLVFCILYFVYCIGPFVLRSYHGAPRCIVFVCHKKEHVILPHLW